MNFLQILPFVQPSLVAPAASQKKMGLVILAFKICNTNQMVLSCGIFFRVVLDTVELHGVWKFIVKMPNDLGYR